MGDLERCGDGADKNHTRVHLYLRFQIGDCSNDRTFLTSDGGNLYSLLLLDHTD